MSRIATPTPNMAANLQRQGREVEKKDSLTMLLGQLFNLSKLQLTHRSNKDMESNPQACKDKTVYPATMLTAQ